MKDKKVLMLGIIAAMIFGGSAGAFRLVTCQTAATLHGNERAATSPTHSAYIARAEGNASDGSARAAILELQMYNGSSWQTLESKTMAIGSNESTGDWGRAELDQTYSLRIRLTPYNPPIIGNPGAIGYGTLYVDPYSAD